MVNRGFVTPPLHLAVVPSQDFLHEYVIHTIGFPAWEVSILLGKIAAMKRRQTEKRSLWLCVAQRLECCGALLICRDSERIPGG
jgi:hypothetical protein